MGEKKPIITQKLLPKEKLSDLISELNKKFKIYAPVNDNGIVSFNEISNIKEIYLDYLNSRIPPKNVLFPQVETIFTYKKHLELDLVMLGVSHFLKNFSLSENIRIYIFLKDKKIL
jgi:hypothetical protein